VDVVVVWTKKNSRSRKILASGSCFGTCQLALATQKLGSFPSRSEALRTMKSKTTMRWTGILSLAAIVGLSAPIKADAAFTNTGVASFSESFAFGSTTTEFLGFNFTANSNLVVSALSAFEASSTAINVGQTVVLYDVTTSSTVATATYSSVSGLAVGQFAYINLVPQSGPGSSVTLNTGDVYSIYSLFQGNASGQFGSGSLTFSSDITNVTIGGSNTGIGASTNSPPPLTSGFPNVIAVSFGYSSAVPEPASLAMFGMGAIGIAGVMVRHRRRTN
jgi:PEP-CTERM motif